MKAWFHVDTTGGGHGFSPYASQLCAGVYFPSTCLSLGTILERQFYLDAGMWTGAWGDAGITPQKPSKTGSAAVDGEMLDMCRF
jgi:hypothetical protein